MMCLHAAPRYHDAVPHPQKTMMPTTLKCYIVLRATAFLRKESL
jgi:hypothetical protein